MDDGIGAIALILSVMFVSLFFFTYLIKELVLVFLVVSIVLIPIYVYTCLIVIAAKGDKNKVTKEWEEYEALRKIQPPSDGSPE